MVSDSVKPALRAALRAHEIGKDTPYRISFAGKGNSGASFGFMQGDLAAHQPVATDAFKQALKDDFPEAEIEALLAQLSTHSIKNPLSLDMTERVDAALASHRDVVDAMDEEILASVYADLDRCLAACAEGGRTMSDTAQIYAALWINMTGPPTQLLRWLRGEVPQLPTIPPPAPQRVNASAMQSYLLVSRYYSQNPANFAHMKECVAIGAALLPA